MNNQNNGYWYSRNRCEVHEMSLNIPEGRVCYPVSAHKKIRTVVYEETANPNHSIH